MDKNRKTQRLVYLSLLFTLLMIAARIIYTQDAYGLYLVWNLFLAWIPFALSFLVWSEDRKKWISYAVIAGWLLFLPNAPYIITDFFHLKHRPPVPYWYDLLILFWSAWNGLLMGFISLMNIENFLHKKFTAKTVNITVNIFVVLCAFGIYAGRYLRWNSWDVVANPGDILSDVKFIALNPEDNLRTWGVTFFFSILMLTCYKTLKNLNQFVSK